MFPVEYQTLPKTHVRRSQRCREIAGWEGSHERSPAPGPLGPLGPGHSGERLIRGDHIACYAGERLHQNL